MSATAAAMKRRIGHESGGCDGRLLKAVIFGRRRHSLPPGAKFLSCEKSTRCRKACGSSDPFCGHGTRTEAIPAAVAA